MLLTIPVELQTQVVSYLPRRDLASAILVSRHVHEIAIPFLYESVVLRSFEQVESFFLVTSTLTQGSLLYNKHEAARRGEWESIKILKLRLGAENQRLGTLGVLPRSLRGARIPRLRIAHLRLQYHSEGIKLLPLFRCLDPVAVSLAPIHTDRMIEHWTADAGWTGVTSFRYIGPASAGIPTSRSNQKATALPFGRLQSATLVELYNWTWMCNVRLNIAVMLRLCPVLTSLEVVVSDYDLKLEIEQLSLEGIEGRPASFFSIVSPSAGYNGWGDLQDA